MPKNRVQVVFEREVMQALLERQEQKGYESIQMVLYDIIGEWYASKVAAEWKAEPTPKRPILLTLQEGINAQLTQEQARKGYPTIQMVLYEIVGEWYAQQRETG